MRIALFGDIALIGKNNIWSSKEWKKCFGYVKDFLLDYDYVIANLESPLTSKVKIIVPKSMHLRSDISGINAVTLANNHMYDYGTQTVKETIEVMK